MIPHARDRLAQAHLYLVCGPLSEDRLNAALRGGVEIVQLRMKTGSAAQVVAAGQRFAAVCAEHGVPLILNDHPDLVEATGADGVHLGQDDIPVGLAREVLGPEAIIGLSTHTPAQIDAAATAPIDYIGVGPVHSTPTKPGRHAVGTELVSYATAHAELPFFAIGGIDVEQVGPVLRAGARRIAVLRAIADAPDPEQAARTLLGALGREAHVGAA